MSEKRREYRFLTTVPPTMSDLTLKPREKDRPVAAKSEGELALFEIPKTRSTEDASDMCSGDYNTSCVDEIKKDLEKRRKKKPLQKMIDRMKHNKLHPE